MLADGAVHRRGKHEGLHSEFRFTLGTLEPRIVYGCRVAHLPNFGFMAKEAAHASPSATVSRRRRRCGEQAEVGGGGLTGGEAPGEHQGESGAAKRGRDRPMRVGHDPLPAVDTCKIHT